DEIRKEVRLALAECGRRLGTLLRRKRTKAHHGRRRDVFTRYIDEVVEAARAITVFNKEEFRSSLIELSKRYTAQADIEFDEHGKVIRKPAAGNDLGLCDTIVIDRDEPAPDPSTLFNGGEQQTAPKTIKKIRKRKR
ncbi:unnamed protein product, partial [marine sediment metagenome]